MLQNPHVLLTFDKVHHPLHLPRETTSEPPKMVRTWCALYILTSKCASRHNGVHFFDIWTSQSGPRDGVFCTFWLRNVLRATTACTFSTSELPKVVWQWCVVYILTCKCASRHNGVQFFISHLASWLRTRRFSEPTFRPSGAPNHWKNTVFRDFPTFSRICIFFLLTLSLLLFFLLIFLFSLPLPCSAFHLSILSEVWLLNFLRRIHNYTPLHSTTLNYTTLQGPSPKITGGLNTQHVERQERSWNQEIPSNLNKNATKNDEWISSSD